MPFDIKQFKYKKSVYFLSFQSVYRRQEMIRKQVQHEHEKRELIQSLESHKVTEPKVLAPKQNLTPLISPAALIAPKMAPKISAVTNMMAIERAKQKVMELKAQKLAQHQQFMPKPTIAQTTPKGTGRVAHTNTNVTAQVVCIVYTHIG